MATFVPAADAASPESSRISGRRSVPSTSPTAAPRAPAANEPANATSISNAVISRINVVYLYVRDMERSTAFYRDVLGIPLEGDGDWIEATFPDGVRFALHQHGDVSPGTINVDFEVADFDDAVGRLRAAGVEVGEIAREQFGCFAGFTDPD